MKQVITLTESDIRRMVMEATAKILDPQYSCDKFDQDAFDAEGDEKTEQMNAAWEAYLNDKPNSIGYDDTDAFRNKNNLDNTCPGLWSMRAQGHKTSPSGMAFAQELRDSNRHSVKASENSWLGGGLGNEEDFGDGIPPIMGMTANDNGKIATRNSYNGRTDRGLSETVNRVIKKYIK